MNYVDGFVAAVPTANREQYIQHARDAAEVFKEHGALRVVECWGDDVPEGKVTSFPLAVQCRPDETVIFSWLVWPSREVRDVLVGDRVEALNGLENRLNVPRGKVGDSGEVGRLEDRRASLVNACCDHHVSADASQTLARKRDLDAVALAHGQLADPDRPAVGELDLLPLQGRNCGEE